MRERHVSIQWSFTENETGNFVLPLYDEDHRVATSETVCGALFLHPEGDLGYSGV